MRGIANAKRPPGRPAAFFVLLRFVRLLLDDDARLHGVESFNAQVSQVIDSLVSSVVEKSEELAALQVRLREAEQQLALERSVRDLERASRLHPKARSVVFVGTIYLGDNVKYAWLAFRERARAQGIACWFLPQDEALRMMEGSPYATSGLYSGCAAAPFSPVIGTALGGASWPAGAASAD